jgi:hypothetical protein
MIEIQPADLMTLAGALAIAELLTLWIKFAWKTLDVRWVSLIVLGLSLGLGVVIRWVLSPPLDGPALIAALLTGFLAATIATFGYEAYSNIAGLFGKGSRSSQ